VCQWTDKYSPVSSTFPRISFWGFLARSFLPLGIFLCLAELFIHVCSSGLFPLNCISNFLLFVRLSILSTQTKQCSPFYSVDNFRIPFPSLPTLRPVRKVKYAYKNSDCYTELRVQARDKTSQSW
jgi:hypothetical protein